MIPTIAVVPETPEEFHRRVTAGLHVPPVGEWDSWPFEGELRVRELRPPEPEPVITGAGGVDCPACTKPDDAYLWTDERWRLLSTHEPTGLPGSSFSSRARTTRARPTCPRSSRASRA